MATWHPDSQIRLGPNSKTPVARHNGGASGSGELTPESTAYQNCSRNQAVLDAVADAPPPSFSGGGKWEAMHGELAGIYEVRVQRAGSNHRLFCLLDRNAEELGGPSLVVIGGLSKPKRAAANSRDYDKVLQSKDEYLVRRTVLKL